MRKCLSVIVLIMLAGGGRAAALNITPMLVEVDAVSGQTYTGSLEVFASPDTGELARVYLRDWDKNSDGTDIEGESGAFQKSCGKWMTVSPSQLDIPANGRISVKYTFTPPPGAVGSYWTFVMVEGALKPSPPVDNGNKVQMMIETRLRYAVRIFINVRGNAAVEGSIKNISVGPPAARSDFRANPLIAAVTFSNTGDLLLKPEGYVEIRNMNGDTILHTGINTRNYVIPGRERVIEVPVDIAMLKGEYIALSVLDYGGENLVAGEAHFSLEEDVNAMVKTDEGIK